MIQNCWFFGCPYGVRGNNTGGATRPGAGLYDTASEIVIQQCEFTDKSPYKDVLELLTLRQAAGEKAVFSGITGIARPAGGGGSLRTRRAMKTESPVRWVGTG